MRDILLYLEEYLTLDGNVPGNEIIDEFQKTKDYTRADLIYSMRKLKEAEFVERSHIMFKDYPVFHDITMLGYEFLENVRSEDVWNKVKEKAKNVGSYSIPVLMKIATKTVLDLLM